MKTKLKSLASRKRLSASAMLVSLMIMSVTTVGVATWIAIINGRTAYTESMEDAMRRRVALENSRGIAEEYMYYTASTQNGAVAASFPVDPNASPNPNPPFNAAQPDIVEQVAIAASGSGPLAETSVAPAGRVNRLGLSDGSDCYHTFYNVLLGRGTNQITRRFELRARSPILYGDLVTLHRPTIDSTDIMRFKGNVQVNGRTVIWRPDHVHVYNDSLYSTEQLVLMDDAYGEYPVYDSAGVRMRPSNFPFTPISAGVAGGGLGYDGRLSTVHNSGNSINSLHGRLGSNPIEANGLVDSVERGVDANGFGSISINLMDPALSKVFIENDTRSIVLNGQNNDTDFADAASFQPVLIVIKQDEFTALNLDTIELTHRNNRRLIVAVKKEINSSQSDSWLRLEFEWANTLTSTNPDTTWRLIAIGENTEIRFQHAFNNSHVTIYGGVRTDRGFYSHNDETKTFTIERETEPDALASLLDRNVWLESYTPDTSP